jgi:hypothetical protein
VKPRCRAVLTYAATANAAAAPRRVAAAPRRERGQAEEPAAAADDHVPDRPLCGRQDGGGDERRIVDRRNRLRLDAEVRAGLIEKRGIDARWLDERDRDRRALGIELHPGFTKVKAGERR